MATSKAATVPQYLRELPPEHRGVVSAVRKTIVDHLPKGYKETMAFGMISYELPLERFPDRYNKKPLCYVGLAAQKNHYAVYLMGAAIDPSQAAFLASEFKKRGMKLDMGKSCVRFKSLDEIPLDVIGRVIASTPPDKFTELYHAGRAGR